MEKKILLLSLIFLTLLTGVSAAGVTMSKDGYYVASGDNVSKYDLNGTLEYSFVLETSNYTSEVLGTQYCVDWGFYKRCYGSGVYEDYIELFWGLFRI